jgi:meiotic recombination protein SPO11
VASEKGVVVGRLTFREDGDHIDCRRMGVGGKAIPPNIDKVDAIASDATFILLVEKDAAFMRLAEDRFYNTYPCIIVTAKGQPDVATRLFLKKLKQELRIPVLALVDSDPYGLKILSVYMKGAWSGRLNSSFFVVLFFCCLYPCLLASYCTSWSSSFAHIYCVELCD